jgi:hypothetical protein
LAANSFPTTSVRGQSRSYYDFKRVATSIKIYDIPVKNPLAYATIKEPLINLIKRADARRGQATRSEAERTALAGPKGEVRSTE